MNERFLNIEHLHALRVRNRGYIAKRLLHPAQEHYFLNSLKLALGEDVYLISTALGLDIYYVAKNQKTSFIIEHLQFFLLKPHQKKDLMTIEERNGHEVLEFFDRALESLSQHPQLFLSCCKKIIAELNALGASTLLNQLLYQSFTKQLNRLSKGKKLPHALKIAKLQTKEFAIIQKFIDRSNKLRSDFLAEKHDN